MDKCGIYKITNQINNKNYIGQSKHIALRWKQHHTEPFNLNSDAYDTVFYRAIRKYGIDNFIFEIIEECPEEKLNEREQYWIWYYDSYSKDKGYNMTQGGQLSSSKKKYDIELVKSLWNEGKTHSEIMNIINCDKVTLNNYLNYLNIPTDERRYRANEYKAITVYQYTSNGKLVNQFNSTASAVRHLQKIYPNASSSNICYACNGKINSAYGYIWSYTPISFTEKTVRHKKVNQYDLNGHYLMTFNTQKDAAQAINKKSVSCITNVCTGLAKTSGGYIWRYYDASLENPIADLTNI